MCCALLSTLVAQLQVLRRSQPSRQIDPSMGHLWGGKSLRPYTFAYIYVHRMPACLSNMLDWTRISCPLHIDLSLVNCQRSDMLMGLTQGHFRRSSQRKNWESPLDSMAQTGGANRIFP